MYRNLNLRIAFNKNCKILQEINNKLVEQNALLVQEIHDLKRKIDDIDNSINTTKLITKEILWSEIFNNTISNSEWLMDKSFSPGRWAVGYQYLYAVYRILNEVKPKNILELGLGQSTKLLGQYAKTNPKVNHIVVEHDQDWIDFYKKENKVPENFKILKLERITKEYKDDDSVLAFKNFKESLLEKPQIIIANKMDLEGSKERLEQFKQKVDLPIYEVSAATNQGLDQVVEALADMLDHIQKQPLTEQQKEKKHVVYRYVKEEPFTITKENDTWVIRGKEIEQFVRKINFTTEEAFLRLSRKLRLLGIEDELRKRGAKTGDYVRILDLEVEYEE